MFEGMTQTAEFSCIAKEDQFWIEYVRLSHGYEEYAVWDPVLQFIQYKCWAAGYSAIYVRLNMQNLFEQELYRKYGFRIIAQEEHAHPHGGACYEYVLKYGLPESRDEIYMDYLRRSGGK